MTTNFLFTTSYDLQNLAVVTDFELVCITYYLALILSNATFDAITATPLTEIDLHCCEKLAQRWVNTDDARPLLNQHWTGTPNCDKIG